jgi:hypothetical protein
MTTETEFVEIRRRMEMLKLARHLLNEDYLKQRAAAYTQWTTDSDHAWKTQGIKLPFPPVPAMPSEADVVARALQLYNHVNAQSAPASPPAPAAAPAVSTPQPEVAPVAAPSVPVAEPGPVIETELMAEPEPEPTPEPVVAPEPTPEPTPEPVSVPVPAIETVLPVSRPETVYTEQVKKIFETPSPAIDPPLDQAVESLVQADAENNRALVPMIRGLIEKGFLQLGHRLGQNKTNKKETD